MAKGIIDKLKQANLVGRGGASYPVAMKWAAVAEAMAAKQASDAEGDLSCGYVICNCSEGEPGVKKDAYLIEKYAARIIDGMKIAIDFLTVSDAQGKGRVKGIFYLNEEYHKKYKKQLERAIKDSGAEIELFKKPHAAGYIGGEETTLLNVIEGKHAEPRLRPPYPVTQGLWGQPTLVNNVETFLDVSRVLQGDYQATRAYTLIGDCLFEEVFELPGNFTIEQILKATHNYPKFDFFVQIGGDASGEVLNHKQLKKTVSGAGTIHIYSTIKYDPVNMIRNWVNFFMNASCGKCVPCREGTYRLSEVLVEARPNWQVVRDILDNMAESSFCALGMSVPIPIMGYVNNVLMNDKNNLLKILPSEKESMLNCFK